LDLYIYIFYFCNNCIIIFTVDPPYFIVQNLQDIVKIEGHMPLVSLLKVTRILKRKKIDKMDLSEEVLWHLLNVSFKKFIFI